jgi:hypothetical protein
MNRTWCILQALRKCPITRMWSSDSPICRQNRADSAICDIHTHPYSSFPLPLNRNRRLHQHSIYGTIIASVLESCTVFTRLPRFILVEGLSNHDQLVNTSLAQVHSFPGHGNALNTFSPYCWVNDPSTLRTWLLRTTYSRGRFNQS